MKNNEMSIEVLKQIIFDCAVNLEYETVSTEQVISKLYELSEVKIRTD